MTLGTYSFTSAAQGVSLGADWDAAVLADAIRFTPSGASISTTSPPSYIHTDHLGTPQKITNSLGSVVWNASYEPFGAATISIATITNSLRFPGQYFDAETGLNQNWWRDYDPSIGRYLQPDPTGLDDGPSVYLYAQANPILLSDFTGLFSYNKPPPDTVPVPAEIEAKVTCIENCLGRKLVITGGAETKGHKKNSRHYGGEAVDFGFNSNPGLQGDPKRFFCCAKKCGFQFGQSEDGKGPHFHLQAGPGSRGGRGAIPKDDSCECKEP